MTRSAVRAPFGQQWLSARLSQLLPGFPGVSLCVALSGGVDSTVLLAALATGARSSARLRAVHVNHGLHSNSQSWSAHCRSLAAALGVPLKILATKVRRVPGESLEAAAREARYALLAADLAKGEILLTAHHEDDQLETVLLQLFRGSGLAGIAAMPEVAPFADGWLARPLLTCSRVKLEEWARLNCAAWAQPGSPAWIEDDTNSDESLDRNYLRRRVVPLIRDRWPSAASSVSRSARHAAEAQRLLDGVARRDVERAADGESLAVTSLRALPPDRLRNALRFWIAQAGVPVPDKRRLDEICGPLLVARHDAHPHVAWNGVRLQREGGRLTIRSASEGHGGGTGGRDPRQSTTRPRGEAANSAAGRATRQTTTGAAEITWHWRSANSCALSDGGKLELRQDPRGPIDLDRLPESLLVRRRAGGERLRPRPGGQSRALKNLLQEAHVSISDRKCLPLIFAGARLLAAADLWHDESIGAGSGTTRRGRFLWRR